MPTPAAAASARAAAASAPAAAPATHSNELAAYDKLLAEQLQPFMGHAAAIGGEVSSWCWQLQGTVHTASKPRPSVCFGDVAATEDHTSSQTIPPEHVAVTVP